MNGFRNCSVWLRGSNRLVRSWNWRSRRCHWFVCGGLSEQERTELFLQTRRLLLEFFGGGITGLLRNSWCRGDGWAVWGGAAGASLPTNEENCAASCADNEFGFTGAACVGCYGLNGQESPAAGATGLAASGTGGATVWTGGATEIFVGLERV